MAVGDSITQGGKREVQEYTYRLPLQMLLHQHGISYDFIGSRHDGLHEDATWPPIAQGVPFDDDHEGYYGKKTAFVVSEAIESYDSTSLPPDVVLVHLGTNDQKYGNFETNVGQPLRNLIQFVRIRNPNVIVLLGHLNFNASEAATKIREVVEGVALDLNTLGSPVITVHHYQGWIENPDSVYADTYDWAHPNLKGQEKMARAWWQVLRPYLE